MWFLLNKNKFISRWNKRTLLANSIYRLNHAMIVKLYRPYTEFPRNVRLSYRRVATFSAHRDFLIMAPYKYFTYLLTYLLTYLPTYLLVSFFVDKYLCQFCGKTPANRVVGTEFFIRRLRMLSRSSESLRHNKTTRLTETQQCTVEK